MAAVAIAVLSLAPAAQAAETGAPAHGVGAAFLWIVIILLAAKLSTLVERLGQPPVLGELVMGVILGNLFLTGLDFFEPIKSEPIINFLAQLGVVILLFQVGLESNIEEMRRVGLRAFWVACVGVIVPFLLAMGLVGPLLLPGLPFNTYLFLGATLAATSVGITARVFRDLGRLQTAEAQIVLGAAVIDDVLGLIILAVVSAIVTEGTISVGSVSWITLKAFLFLAGAVVLGQLLAPRLGALLSKVHTGTGMKFTLAISFGLITAYLGEQIGLAPIVGAFAAGLVLDPVHFRFFEEPEIANDIRDNLHDAPPAVKARVATVLERHADRHVEDIIEPLGHFLAPIFFVITGMAVRLETLFNLPILLVALGITIAAFVGKIAAGLVAGPVNKSIVGWGMIPRGEVGLIFAATGRAIGVVNDEVFSIIVIMVILSTLLPPPILTYLLKRDRSVGLPASQPAVSPEG
ncbi:MAG: cation:proton antiporter [Anaerolineales bacterium]|nr:cation:proton antiporter [Anaerolineales bacterium]